MVGYLSNWSINLLNPKCTLLVTSYCTLRACKWVLRQQKWRDGGVKWGYLQGDMHMAAARLGCKRTMVGTRWANSHPGCMNRLRKHYSQLVGGSGRLLGSELKAVCTDSSPKFHW